MALKEIKPVGIVCHVCDKTAKFFDENKKEIKAPSVVRWYEDVWRKFVLSKVEQPFADKLISKIERWELKNNVLIWKDRKVEAKSK